MYKLLLNIILIIKRMQNCNTNTLSNLRRKSMKELITEIRNRPKYDTKNIRCGTHDIRTSNISLMHEESQQNNNSNKKSK